MAKKNKSGDKPKYINLGRIIPKPPVSQTPKPPAPKKRGNKN